MEAPTLIIAARIVDGTGAPPVENGAVLVENGRIAYVGPRQQIGTPDGARVVDHGRRTLLPGLIDCHSHPSYSFPGDPPAGEADCETLLVLRAAHNLRQCLHSGVTSMRVCGERAFMDIVYRDAERSGLLEGPRLIISTRAVVASGMNIILSDVHVTGVDEVRRIVRENIRFGADFIKCFATASSTNRNPLYSCFTPEEIEAIVGEAHSYGLKVAAHCQGGPSAQLFARAGLDSLEHGIWATDEDMAVLAEHGTWFVPTHQFWLSQDPETSPPPLRKAILAAGHAITRAKNAGVTVCAGSDSGHGKFALELTYLVRWGLSEMEAIRGATGLAAELCGVAETVGTLAPGKLADLVAVDGNPLDDIKTMSNVDWVMKGGKVVQETPSSIAERAISQAT